MHDRTPDVSVAQLWQLLESGAVSGNAAPAQRLSPTSTLRYTESPVKFPITQAQLKDSQRRRTGGFAGATGGLVGVTG